MRQWLHACGHRGKPGGSGWREPPCGGRRRRRRGAHGRAAPARRRGRVTLLEASERLGGKLRTGEIGGVRVDLGAESMLARRPEAVGLAREAGLANALQPPATASASLWTRDALRPMPKGHVMGVPADPASLAGVLSEEGVARIAEDRTLPRTEVGEDIAVGEYVAARVGREVVDRLVEPLLGGVYAGNAYRISLRAAVPQLFAAARDHTALTEGSARSRPAPPPTRAPTRSSWASTAGSAASRSPSPTPSAPAAAASAPVRPSPASPAPRAAGG
ncbi:FAD-dependent oxidoreductase [Actinomadura keratinilytica]